MPERSRKRPTDVNERAKGIVDELTRQTPKLDPDAGKDPAAVELGLAMAAGVTDHVWTLAELVALLENAEQGVPMKCGPYKKRAA